MIAGPYGALKLSKFAYTHEADTGTYCVLKDRRLTCGTHETESRHYVRTPKDIEEALPAHFLQRSGVDLCGLWHRVRCSGLEVPE
jgi:hypothetical protein